MWRQLEEQARLLDSPANRVTLRNTLFEAVAPLGTLWGWVKPLIRVGRKSEEYGNGLFCLKGGDLKQEFAESGVKPRVLPVSEIFEEEIFQDKFVVYVPK